MKLIAQASFQTTRTRSALANDPAALVDHLDTLLASSQLTDATKNNIVQTIDSHPADE
jgi:hypothetical protein